MAALPRIAAGALVAACFLAGLLVARPAAPQDFETHGNWGRTANMTAVTGEVLRDVAALYVTDHETRRVAVYRFSAGDGEVALVAARNARYDLELRAFRDGSDRIVDVRVLRELFRRATGPDDFDVPGGKKPPK